MTAQSREDCNTIIELCLKVRRLLAASAKNADFAEITDDVRRGHPL